MQTDLKAGKQTNGPFVHFCHVLDSLYGLAALKKDVSLSHSPSLELQTHYVIADVPRLAGNLQPTIVL